MLRNFFIRKPLERFIVTGGTNYRICSRCVMDTSDPNIKFNRFGECNHCCSFLTRRLRVTSFKNQKVNLSALEKVFLDIKKQRSNSTIYDVIIGVSGGVDSSYTVVLAREAGLRTLAVHMDNGWDTSVSVRNIQRLIRLSGVDYRSVVLDWNKFRIVQRAFLESGTPDIELPTDIAIQTALHKLAKQFGIRSILSGGNIANEGILPAAWLYNARDDRYARAIIRSAGYPETLYDQIAFPLVDEIKYRFFSKIQTAYPLNFFNYDKGLAKKVLSEKIGWQDYGGKHCESIFTRFAQLIYLPARHKIDYRRGYLSADICLGRVSRKEALSELESPPLSALDIRRDISFVANKLGYDEDQIFRLMRLPHRWYTDFPNQEKRLALLYGAYRFFTGRMKASNF